MKVFDEAFECEATSSNVRQSNSKGGSPAAMNRNNVNHVWD